MESGGALPRWMSNGVLTALLSEQPAVNTTCRQLTAITICIVYLQGVYPSQVAPYVTSMARLNEEGLLDSNVDASDHILSPQPCARPSKNHLLSLETSHLLSEKGSTVNDDQISAQKYEHSSSSPSERHSTSDVFGREMDDELAQLKSRASSRSSLSSIPASVLVHPLHKAKQAPALNVHDKLAGYDLEDDEANFGNFDGPTKSIRPIRQREAVFRKPSSVRAMQMHTEDEDDDDEYLTPPRRRGGMRSPGSSPLKRSPYYSPNAAANKPKVKKEFPLVLLHCNLLAASLPVLSAAEPQNQKVVEEVLPPIYWKRWRKLQDKVGSGVLRDRGVLISHPEDLYDLLEERLLESLELQRSRLYQGHFLGHEDSGAGSEGESSDRGASETDGEQGEECPDCGVRVLRHGDSNRKWEIKVFAANGLMRAGAWAAAWKEMEKVDVEVGVWLPSDVRRVLEKRLAEESVANALSQSSPAVDHKGLFETDPRRQSVHTFSQMDNDAGSLQAGMLPASPTPTAAEPVLPRTGHEQQQSEIALQTLVFNYIRVLASDRRNVALVIMSALVVFLAIGSRPMDLPPQSAMHPVPTDIAEPDPVTSVNIAISSSAFALPRSGLSEGVSTPSVAVPSSATASTIPTSTEDILSQSSNVEPETHLRAPETTDQSNPEATEMGHPVAQGEDEIEQPAVAEADNAIEQQQSE